MFSVVIPLYNKEKFIVRAIESVIHQTKQDFEIIVVDDGSTDGSIRRVRELQCDRIHLIQQSNAGPGPARNRGVQESRYDDIAFLDADDAFLPDHLEELQKIIECFPQAVLFSTKFAELKDPLYQVENFPKSTISKKVKYKKYNYFRKWRPRCGYIFSSCVAIKKQAFMRAGGFKNICPGEDTELWIRLALEHDFAISTRVTALYIRGTGGIIETTERRNQGGETSGFNMEKNPSFKTLREARRSVSYKSKWRDIDRYMHQRLMTAFRMRLVWGDISEARKIFSEINFVYSFTAFFWKIALIFPDRFVLSSVKAGVLGKRFIKKII